MTPFFLTAKDLAVYFPTLSRDGLRRKNTEMKKQYGIPPAGKLTQANVAAFMGLTLAELENWLKGGRDG